MSEEQIVPVEDASDNYQTPQTDQGPDPKPVEVEDEKPKNTRDAVKDAMASVKARGDAKTEAKGKDAKPDEAAKAEKPVVEKAPDPKAAPDAKAEEKPGSNRGADGKFARAERDGSDAEPAERAQPTDKPVADADKAPTAENDAPARFSEAAKREWAAAPESVRTEVKRAMEETERGIAKYRQSHEEYEQIREYREMAAQSGTTLKAALDNYVGMEKMLRQDPIAGLNQLVANMGLRGPNGQPVTFRDIAASVMGQTPDQAARQNDMVVQSLRQQINAQNQQLAEATRYIQEQQTQHKIQAATSEWDRFAASNPRARELESHIAEVLQQYPAGDSIPASERLRDAYAIAAARYPMTAQTGAGNPDAAQTGQGQKETVQRVPNPNGQKSISGSPSSAAEIPKAKDGKALSSREAVQLALRRASGI